MAASTPLLRVAVLNDYPVVVAGLAHILSLHDSRILVVEIDSQLPVLSDVDIVVYDAFATTASVGPSLADLVQQSDAKVVLFAGDLSAPAIAAALEAGVAAYVSKRSSSDELVAALEAVHRGETLVTPSLQSGEHPGFGDWPGRGSDLSTREAEVIAYIAGGHTNDDIARALFLSINSVKTYIRSAYRKMGVQRRTQAVLWAMENGFVSESTRRLPGLPGDLSAPGPRP